METFGLVTVMNVHVYKLPSSSVYNYNTVLDNASFNNIAIGEDKYLYLDTLKISNISDSAPKKVFKAGLLNMPIIRHGKTTTLTINDALGRLSTLQHFFGLERSENTSTIYSTESFVGPLTIEGEMKIVNLNGDVETLYLFVPCLLPSGQLTLTQDAEGGVGVMDLSGELYPMLVRKYFEDDGVRKSEERRVKYLISDESFFTDAARFSPRPIYEEDAVALVSGMPSDIDPTMVYNGDTVSFESGFDEN